MCAGGGGGGRRRRKDWLGMRVGCRGLGRENQATVAGAHSIGRLGTFTRLPNLFRSVML